MKNSGSFPDKSQPRKSPATQPKQSLSQGKKFTWKRNDGPGIVESWHFGYLTAKDEINVPIALSAFRDKGI